MSWATPNLSSNVWSGRIGSSDRARVCIFKLQVLLQVCPCWMSAAVAASQASWPPNWWVRLERSSVSIGRQPPSQPRALPPRRVHSQTYRCDPVDMAYVRPFDAVVGRYVLMFQADASAMLRGLARHVRPGGVIVFTSRIGASCSLIPSP